MILDCCPKVLEVGPEVDHVIGGGGRPIIRIFEHLSEAAFVDQEDTFSVKAFSTLVVEVASDDRFDE